MLNLPRQALWQDTLPADHQRPNGPASTKLPQRPDQSLNVQTQDCMNVPVRCSVGPVHVPARHNLLAATLSIIKQQLETGIV